ncbi:MAG: protein kinase [Cyanophyceae cyanobacterium]
MQIPIYLVIVLLALIAAAIIVVFVILVKTLVSTRSHSQHSTSQPGSARQLKSGDPSPSHDSSDSSLILNRYRVREILRQTQFGQTYVAEDLQSNKRKRDLYLIKHFDPQMGSLSKIDTARRLFQGEAEVLDMLADLSQIPQGVNYLESGDDIWLLREYIVGHPLNEELIEGKPCSEAQVLDVLRRTLPILGAIHQRNIIHRDVKPDNLIRRDSDQQLILIDFGAAKERDPDDEVRTMMTVSIGTPSYTPYEQLFGKPVFASDIYALGVIGIQMLTGRPPNRIPIDMAEHEYQWRDLARVNPTLGGILDKMICFRTPDRYGSAEAVLKDLDAL